MKKNNQRFRIKTNKKYTNKNNKHSNKNRNTKNKKTNKNRNKKLKKMRLYGGSNSIRNYNNTYTGTPVLTQISSEAEVEHIFNPNTTPCWKQVNTARIKVDFIYEYEAYNSLTRLFYPIYFGNLPKQVSLDQLYTPIYIYTETIQTPIPEDLLTIYNYIVNTLFNDEWEICLRMAQRCPWSQGLKGHASRTCCGFNAPAIGVILQYYTRSMINNSAVTAREKMNAINVGLNLYSILTGYGNSGISSPNSWNANCHNPNFFKTDLKEGSNIITFYGRLPNPGCATYHHFVVYKKTDYCIIIDSWAGTGGHRGEWARIMKTDDIVNVLREISTTTSLDETNKLLNEYFIVPHGVSDVYYPNNIDTNKQQELLSVGANNLVDLESGILSELQTISAQDRFVPYYGGRKA